MRIHTIKLKHFRGVTENTIEFTPQGVTVIIGPNEIGKSSIPEGLDVLLRLPHDSKRTEVTELKPVDIDAGPEVEADIGLGEYRFVYSKRWLKNPSTTLTISEPHHQQFTGRDAHDKVNELLASHLDRPLFDALRYVQGTAIGQHGISKSTSLMAALDQATSAQSVEPERGASLIDSIETEFERFYTPGGKVRTERTQLVERLNSARANLEAAKRSLGELEQLGTEFSSVSERISSSEDRMESCRMERVEIDTVLAELDSIERDLAEAANACELAASQQSGVLRDHATRVALINAETEADADVVRLRSQRDSLAETLTVSEEASLEVSKKVAAQEQIHRAASLAEDEARLELQRREARVAVGLLGRRIEEFEQSENLRVAATRVLEENDSITSKARTSLDQALTRVTQAEAVRTAGQPTVDVEPSVDMNVEVDGVYELIAGHMVRRWNVAGNLTLRLGEMATITVAAPTDREVEDEASTAKSNLARIVEKYGLDSDDPRSDLERRLGDVAAAKQDLVHADLRRDAALFDLAPEQLRAKHENAASLAGEVSGINLSLDVDEAKSALVEATALRTTATLVLDQLTAERRILDDLTNGQRIEASRLDGEISHAMQFLGRTSNELFEARAHKSDAELSTAASSAATILDAAKQLEIDLRIRRDAQAPDTVRASANNLEARERRVQSELEGARTRREQLTGELRALGSKELQADLDRSLLEVDVLETESGSLERRARAAQLLRDTFHKHREIARVNRARPYAEEVNRLARFVFGPSVHVAVNPSDFTVTSRTLDGTTVSFEQLSTGAKEQMSVVATLACAILVNPHGPDGDAGVPVILDDVLGFADPARLRRLGPVFAEAAKSAQVILLTASPDRYESIGEATFIHL